MCVEGEGCILKIVRKYMIHLLPIGNENLFSYRHCTHFFVPSEFQISIHNNKNGPILANYENEIIRISLYSSHFLVKGIASSSRFLIYFKYNNCIQVYETFLGGKKKWM